MFLWWTIKYERKITVLKCMIEENERRPEAKKTLLDKCRRWNRFRTAKTKGTCMICNILYAFMQIWKRLTLDESWISWHWEEQAPHLSFDPTGERKIYIPYSFYRWHTLKEVLVTWQIVGLLISPTYDARKKQTTKCLCWMGDPDVCEHTNWDWSEALQSALWPPPPPP